MNNAEMLPRFPLFHVPHDGDVFPNELMNSVTISRERFFRYHRIMRDMEAAQLVPAEFRGGEHCFRFPVSRLLCDVERFIGPEEPMEALGMGFCYERAFDGTEIKAVSPELKARTLKYYNAHHEKLNRCCREHPRILLVDIHSYSDEIVPGSASRSRPMPDVCIGTDSGYTPDWLLGLAGESLSAAGFSAACNDPYSGTMVPSAVLAGQCGCDLISIMLEFHKRAYLDDTGVPREKKLRAVHSAIRELVCEALRKGI